LSVPRLGCVRPSDFASEGAGIVGPSEPIFVIRSTPTCRQRNVRCGVSPEVASCLRRVRSSSNNRHRYRAKIMIYAQKPGMRVRTGRFEKLGS
jgi:hypothetical protein